MQLQVKFIYMGCEMVSRVWKDGVVGEIEIEPVETVEQDEPITFNNKQELNEYIENFIVEFLTEGDTK